MLFEIHMLKNYAVNNLNRDDMGAPKTCIFGGANRSRISSQCLKRSWRTSDVFAETVGEDNLGIRTRKMPELVRDKMIELGVSESDADVVMRQMSAVGNKEGKESKDGSKTAQVVFYSQADINKLTEAAVECLRNKKAKDIKSKDVQEIIKDSATRPITIDIALFGRMVTSDIFRDVEAATEVAHAISTHKVALEEDYFVAMDDLVSGKLQSDSGAGMIEDAEYSSSCYYIYASVDTDILAENLKDSPDCDILVKKAVEGLMLAMAFSDPCGKQHGMSAHALPSFAICECKNNKVNVSYANAFAKPVTATGNSDIVAKSISELLTEQQNIKNDFGVDTDGSFVFCASRYRESVCIPENDCRCDNYKDLVNKAIELL